MNLRRVNLLPILLMAGLTALFIRLAFFMTRSSQTSPHASRKTVADRLAEFGDAARARLKPGFDRAGINYPPASVELVAIKSDRVMEVYASDTRNSNRWIHAYPILAASGHPGPKLKEGDLQVPEGIYPIESLNPNSAYHVSLRLGYPNEFDRAMGAWDGRSNLGGDIMIHGKAVSVGCLAMGDRAAEELFALVADTGLPNVKVVITPVDFRAGKSAADSVNLPGWCDNLYGRIKNELAVLPQAKSK